MTTPEPAGPTATDEPDRRPSPVARAAGVAFLPLPLVLLVLGLGAVFDDPTQPGSGCFEYCSFDRDIGRLALGLGIIGIWIAVLIWRRHVAAMALALFVTALATGLWGIGFFAPIVAGNLALLVQPPLLAIGALLIVQDALLVAALRVEMIRAGDHAVAAVSAVDPGGPPASA